MNNPSNPPSSWPRLVDVYAERFEQFRVEQDEALTESHARGVPLIPTLVRKL